MGWLVERPGADGKTLYMAVYRDLHGRQRSAGTFSGKKQANKAWQRAELDLEAGKVGDPRRGRQALEKYVRAEWFPHHIIELTTREGYTYVLNRYLLPELGAMRMREFLPSHVREWISTLQTKYGLNPPTIAKCKVVLDAIFTTAFNDQIVAIHPGKGVKTPAVAQKTRKIVTPEEFDRLYCSFEDNGLRLLLETDIESGLRWGELTELRPRDINFSSSVLTVSRAVVHLKAKDRPDGVRFVVKDYPKNGKWRKFRIPEHLLGKLKDHIATVGIGDEDLLFEMRQSGEARRRTVPDTLADPDTLGMTEPNDKGRIYKHGTTSAYNAGRCRCRYCKDAFAAYRAGRRATGRDRPRSPRMVRTDGHISGDWFRSKPWRKALAAAGIGLDVTPHGLRHAHASWLLAGGADLVVVKERLGHGTISTTEKYLHTLPGGDDAAMRAMDAIRGRVVSLEAVEPTTSVQPDGTDVAAMMAKLNEMYEMMKVGAEVAAS